MAGAGDGLSVGVLFTEVVTSVLTWTSSFMVVDGIIVFPLGSGWVTVPKLSTWYVHGTAEVVTVMRI